MKASEIYNLNYLTEREAGKMNIGNKTYITCSSNNSCSYKSITSLGCDCSYSGYCDFQLPRDSRPQRIFPPVSLFNNLKAEVNCPYCKLPLSQCRGHATCRSKLEEEPK